MHFVLRHYFTTVVHIIGIENTKRCEKVIYWIFFLVHTHTHIHNTTTWHVIISIFTNDFSNTVQQIHSTHCVHLLWNKIDLNLLGFFPHFSNMYQFFPTNFTMLEIKSMRVCVKLWYSICTLNVYYILWCGIINNSVSSRLFDLQQRYIYWGISVAGWCHNPHYIMFVALMCMYRRIGFNHFSLFRLKVLPISWQTVLCLQRFKKKWFWIFNK